MLTASASKTPLAATARCWLASPAGSAILQKRVDTAAKHFLDTGLKGRLATELEAAAQRSQTVETTLTAAAPDGAEITKRKRVGIGGPAVFQLGHSLRQLTEELALLSLGYSLGATISEAVWRAAREHLLPSLEAIDPLCFQGRNNSPPWRSDLWTADIGASLACAVTWNTPLVEDYPRIAAIIRQRCLEPIWAEWLSPESRIHSLDTMGHNWWSVIVAAAGIMSSVVGLPAETERIASSLSEWFRYSGRTFSRKRPNFGAEGDFLEGYHYCEYALSNICIFSQVFPKFRLIGDGLTQAQAAGLSRWLQHSFIPTKNGLKLQQFGDVSQKHEMRAEVWHWLGRELKDAPLLAIAHELRPFPITLAEFLLWNPNEEDSLRRQNFEAPLCTFLVSGYAFDRGATCCLSVRAGEYWNHNHLDAGTFIFSQDGVIWADDSGTCSYGHSDYLDYFVTPEAHNIAYAPKLSPPIRHSFREGLPGPASFVSAHQGAGLTVLGVDTGILSGGALSRSYRWIFRLGDAGIVVWDDLSAYTAQHYVSLFHTACTVTRESSGPKGKLQADGASCRFNFFSDALADLDISSVSRGGSLPQAPLLSPRVNTRLRFETKAVERVKLGLSLGSQIVEDEWSALGEDRGWTYRATDSSGDNWRIWFNPGADGRNTHLLCTREWAPYQTDAYALIIRNSRAKTTVWAIEASVVRLNGVPIFSHLSRLPFTALQV